MSTPIPCERHRLDSLIGRCQLFAGRIVDRPRPDMLVSDLRELTPALPDVLSLPEELLVRSLLSRLLGRVVRLAHLEMQPDVARAFLAWEAPMFSSGTLRHEWSHVVECCAGAMTGMENREASDAPDACVRRVLGVIHTRFHDSALNLSTVSKSANLSPWHLARILKRETGHGFVSHLRRARVSAAQQLLVESPLSVKEIAAAVGYAHPNQLDRHFMQTLGVTPSDFRRSVRRSLAG